MDLLKNYNCDAVQGWHIGRPASANDVGILIDGLDRFPTTQAVSG